MRIRAGCRALAVGAESRRPNAGHATVRSRCRESAQLLTTRVAGANGGDGLNTVRKNYEQILDSRDARFCAFPML